MNEVALSSGTSPDSRNGLWTKSFVANLLSFVVMVIGYVLPEPWRGPVLSIGLFAFSGAITNWLAVHMLFEKVPGLYGSGVIPLRFEEFKSGILQLMKQQFFNRENLQRFLGESTGKSSQQIPWEAILNDVNFDPAFESLKEAVKESPFGGMLNMFGGDSALEPLRGPFSQKMKSSIRTIAQSDNFQNSLRKHLSTGLSTEAILEQIDIVIKQRLDELTPDMVKNIIQDMIRIHLGWLVVWGGVFGGLIGLAAHFIQ
ncbi:MAG: DUF445 domain-containing protein [Verrucomicrobia bacterium]|nr:DUF445 domain-containing protein [Verrucomicrobiota bacterium]